MSIRLTRLALAGATALTLTACSGEASACERLEALGDEPGPTEPAEEQREFAEVFAQCMQEEPERGSDR